MTEGIQKLAVPVKCTTYGCKFNGVILILRESPKESSVKKEECPTCHSIGCLELIRI